MGRTESAAGTDQIFGEMVMMGIFIVGSVVLVAAILWLQWISAKQTNDADWLPSELQGAVAAMIEQTLRVDRPFPIVGRPDRVYRLADGLHVPLEYKHRTNTTIYDTEVAQLSLQAWLLRHVGNPTASFGFVVIDNPDTKRKQAVRVTLYDDVACERLIVRYLDLIEGRAKPRGTRRSKKCAKCGHQKYCA